MMQTDCNNGRGLLRREKARERSLGRRHSEVLQHLRILADPTRLGILRLLASRELPVGELARAVGVSPNAASQQLRLLRALGMVTSRRQGRKVLYRIVSERLDALLADIERVRALLTGGGVWGT